MNSQMIGYIRVSTVEQNIGRQNELLQQYNLDEVFTDYASGKDTARPQLQAALKYLRKGDCLVIASMDRLARNLDDLRKLVNDLTSRSIKIKFIKENLTFGEEDSPLSNLLLSLMGAFAEFERLLIKERQREGILLAKNKGLYKGRKKCLTNTQVIELQKEDAENKFKHRNQLAKKYCISRPTLYKYLHANNTNSS